MLRFERLECRALLSISTVNIPAWQPNGPGPITPGLLVGATPNNSVGAIESIAVHANDPNNPAAGYIVYAGTVNGGVWRTDNILAADPTQIHWTPLTDPQASLATSSMALDPLDSSGQTLWVGTGSLSNAGGGGPDVGLLKTTDGGATWTDLGKAYLQNDRIVSVVPTGNLVAGKEVVLVAGNDQSGVMRSTDGGRSFFPVSYNVPLGGIPSATSLMADPNNKSRFFAAVNGKVFQSTDGGLTWNTIDPGIAGSSALKLAVYANGAGTVLYAELETTTPPPAPAPGPLLTGVYRAVIPNSGQPSWLPILNATPLGPAPLPSMTLFTSNSAITADPTNANVVFVSSYANGTASVIYRADASNNTTWKSLVRSGVQPHPDSRALVFLNPNTLLESDDGGIYLCGNPRDGTNNIAWSAINGDIQDTEFFRVAYDSHNHLIFGGSQDNGTPVQTTPGGTQWQPLPGSGGDGGNVAVDKHGASAVHYFFDDSVFFRDGARVQMAQSGGAPQGSGLNPADQAAWSFPTGFGGDSSFPVVTHPTIPGRILLAMSGLYESTDGGDVVNELYPPGMTGGVSALAYGTDNPEAIYVGSGAVAGGSGQIFLRSSAGGPFSLLSSPWSPGSGTFATKIVVDADNFQIVYVLDSTGKVWETSTITFGGSWADVTGNLDSLCSSIQTIALYDPTPGSQPGDDVLVAGGLGGVFHQIGIGANQWSQYGSGLPNVQVDDLDYDQSSGVLIAATFGRGAWTVPNAGNTLAHQGILQINGDNPAGNTIDVRLDPANPQFLEVLENSQVQFDGPYTEFVNINILPGSGTNTIDVENVPAGLKLTVNSVGTDTVNIANIVTPSLGVRGIVGSVDIENSRAGGTTLNVDDTGDNAARTTTLGNVATPGSGYISVAVPSPANIYYGYSATASLTIATDSVAGNQINVLENGVPTYLIGSAVATISIGDNTVGAQDILGNLYIESGEFGTPDAGNMSVIVNDTANKTARNATVSTFTPQKIAPPPAHGTISDSPWGSISGLARATINYEYLDTSSVTIDPGPLDSLIDNQNQGDHPPLIHFAVPPAVTGVNPTSGKKGDTVTVFGYDLGGATAVKFGNTAATILSITPPLVPAPPILAGIWDVVVSAPQGAGVVDVSVTTPYGKSTLANAFTYVPAPTVTGVTPSAGPLTGPDTVAVFGTNLGGATAVDFGANPSTSFPAFQPDPFNPAFWEMIASVPPGAAGSVDVKVVTPGGMSTLANGFTYTSAPVVSAVSADASGPLVPPAGPLGGGTTVYISGANLSTATEVDFGPYKGTIVSKTATRIVATSKAGAAGTVDVTVVTPGGRSATSAADKFTYTAAPVLIPSNVFPSTAVFPNFGPYEGGTTVTISGANLAGATAVDFGTIAGTIVSDTATQIVAVSPGQALGSIVDVTVTTAGGTSAILYSDLFQYTHEPPYVYGVSPPSGDVAGGTTLTITGLNLLGATEVDFGSVLGGPKATSFTINSPTQITATTPAALSVGTVDVTVLTPGERSAVTAADHFTYTSSSVPIFSSLSPSYGPIGGGTTVAIIGTNLAGATAVYFGSTLGTNLINNANGTITVTSPARAAGTVDVTVVTPIGTSATTPADHFTYQIPGPVVSGLSPNSGPPAGVTSVTITGSNLSGATAVYFGGNLATNLTNNANGTITVTSPAGAAGAVDVTVVTAGGTSAVTPFDQFNYGAVPSVSLLSPSIGPANQSGLGLFLFGTNLTGATEVLFGQTAVTAFNDYNQGTTISLAIPDEPPGTVDVRVVTPNGESPITAADQFTFTAAAHITSGEGYGSAAGGSTLPISGWNMQGATAVSFGGVPAESFTVNSNGVDTTINAVAPPGTPGVVAVTVTTPQGTASITNGFRYFAVPTITSVTPATGPLAGGNTVLITGTGLSGGIPNGYQVYFGGIPGTDGPLPYLYDTDTTLAITVPAGTSLGTVDVTVVSPGGTSATSSADQYTYEPPPAVTGLSRSSGPVDGGTTLTITGTGLANASEVDFGAGNPRARIVSETDTQLVVVSPSAVNGTFFGAVDVTVKTPNGTSATSATDQFTYTNAPFISAVQGNLGQGLPTGHAAGGDTVRILGDNLDGATAVTFGGVAATIIGDSSTELDVTSPAGAPGTVDVSVTTPNGATDISTPDQFTYLAVPSVTGIGPSSGGTFGGTQVLISGAGLANATQVVFRGQYGPTAATIISDTDNQILVASPIGNPGVVDVTVTTPGGSSAISPADQFAYVQSPYVNTVSPAVGAVLGGDLVTIGGIGLGGVQSVLFGANPGTIVSDTDTRIVVLSPEAAGDAAGTVDVTVTTRYGTSPTAPSDQFTYAPPPAATGISPSLGPATGGTQVVISGNGLYGATAVDFGSTPAFSFFVDSFGEVVAFSPAGAASTVDVTVVTPGGTSATLSADQFTYVAAPRVSAISPASGPISGGTQVTIAGTDLAGATKVDFNDGVGDDFVGTNVGYSNGQILVTSPNFGFAATVDVTVTTVGGTSATSPADQFTYAAAPSFSGISRLWGSTLGGDLLTITGTNLNNPTAVDFGPNAATIFSETATQIVAISPPGAAGLVDVRVVTPSGVSATSSVDQFTYVAPPVAVADSYTTIEGSTLTVAAPGVLANDTDPQGLPLTATLASDPMHGTLTFSSDGSFTYTPDSGYLGADSFIYQASNTYLSSVPTTVSLTIGAPTLIVTNTTDNGPGSLRQAILDANAAPGVPETIQFQLPAGPQTINLLTPLPPVTNPVTVTLDATQNVTIQSPPGSFWGNSNSLTRTGAGTLIVVAGIEGTGNLTVNAGSNLTANHIIQNALVIGGTAGAPAMVTIAASDANGNPAVASIAASDASGNSSAIASASGNPASNFAAQPSVIPITHSNRQSGQTLDAIDSPLSPPIGSAFLAQATTVNPAATGQQTSAVYAPTAGTPAFTSMRLLMAATVPSVRSVASYVFIDQPSAAREAIDAALVDDSGASVRVDDALLDLLANDAWRRS